MAKVYVSLILACFLIFTVNAQKPNHHRGCVDAAEIDVPELDRPLRERRSVDPSPLIEAAESNVGGTKNHHRGRRAIYDLLNKFQGEHKYQSDTNKDKFGQIVFNKDKLEKQPQTTPSSPTTTE